MEFKTLNLDIKTLNIATKAILVLAHEMDNTENRPEPWALTLALFSSLQFMADKGLYTREELSEITRELKNNFSRVEGPKRS